MRAILAHDLVTSIFKGNVKTPDDVVSWLDVHQGDQPAPSRFLNESKDPLKTLEP
jgi:hypothetical protein